jgi:hypothetical protein
MQTFILASPVFEQQLKIFPSVQWQIIASTADRSLQTGPALEQKYASIKMTNNLRHAGTFSFVF